MTENGTDKELRNAMAINEDGHKLEQLKAQLSDIQSQCNANQLATAGKETDALKLYDELIRGMDGHLLKVLSNSDIDDDFHVLEAIISYKREYDSELRRLSRYWPAWFETLLCYSYFLTHRKFGLGGYTFLHVTFVRWLKDIMGENATAYILALAYNTWSDAKVATTDCSD